MVPSDFGNFFFAMAGVSGALIGLLFVAISVSPEAKGPAEQLDFDIRAGVAFSALTSALVVSLFALIPGLDLGVTAIVVAAAGFASCAAFAIVLFHAESATHRRSKLRRLIFQGIAFLFQVYVGIQLIRKDHARTDITNLAVLTVIFSLIGIARAWQLIGAHETGFSRLVREVAAHRRSAE